MAIIDTIYQFSRLRQGKFRNVEFITFKDGTTSGGRKTVTHEYPNSDLRFVEDLGLKKEIYELEIYADTRQGFQRDSLKKVLNEKGTGKLIHPFLGQKTVSVKGWTAVEEFGLCKFNVTFEQSDPAILPKQAKINKSLLEKLKDALKDLGETKITDNLTLAEAGSSTYTAFKDFFDTVQDFSEQMLEVSNAVLNVTSEISTLQNTINDTLDNTATLIKTPSLLGARISNLFTQFELIGERSVDQFNALKSLFGFGSGDEDLPQNTAQQRAIRDNRLLFDSVIRANTLASAYDTAIDIDYTNENELDEVRLLLENEYQSLVAIIDNDILESLKEIRANAELIFQNLEKTVPKIYTVNLVSYQNIYQIVFNYYGNFINEEDYQNKIQEIFNLNNFNNPSKIRGEVKLLT